MLAQLKAVNGRLAGRVILLVEGQKISIGRSPRNSIAVEDENLSRRHSLIESDGTAWIVSDLNSKGGTFVNGQRVTSAVLRDGDRIQAGDSLFEFGNGSPFRGCVETDVSVPGPATVVLAPVRCGRCGGEAHVPESRTSGIKSGEIDASLFCERCATRGVMDSVAGYRMVGRVSEDRLAPVYRVQRGESDRNYALKVLRKSPLSSEEAAHRFLREAAWKGVVQHPGIAEIVECGELDALYYLVMEFVEGCTIEALTVHGGPIPVPVAVGIACQATDALAYLHQKLIVHRDVKPSNLMIGPAGVVKLIDMGSARFLQGSEEINITRSGVGYGTLQFMPPEQAFDAKRVDRRADVYSLGATLYTMVTGKYAFKVHSMADILAQTQTGGWVNPHVLHPAVPESLGEVIHRMMQSDPADRFPGMPEARAALQAFAPAGAAEIGALFQARIAVAAGAGKDRTEMIAF